jgi:glycosyltransferase XagB
MVKIIADRVGGEPDVLQTVPSGNEHQREARRGQYPLNRSEINQAIARLSTGEVLRLMREGWFRYDLGPGVRGHAASDALSAAACRQAGHTITGNAARQDVVDAILSQDGAHLTLLAANRLADTAPVLSARDHIRPMQYAVGAALALLTLAAAVYRPDLLQVLLLATFSVVFVSLSLVRLVAMFLHGGAKLPARAQLGDDELPVYSVLVPVFREANMLPHLIRSLQALRYPAARLDVKIILEEADIETRQMAERLVKGTGFELIVVSPGMPQTKPRALNLALLFARGDLVTIYDAEDIPQPAQLRLAAECFHGADASVACLQARLAYYNCNENWLTRQFTIEYATLFDLILPTLARFGLPLPLGGTSNHFRHRALIDAGGWDAWNVTEDADLGLRLARRGYRCEVLSSTTFEEANCRLGNWMHQRARWLKGWMQTWIVLMRQPLVAWRQMGTAGFLTAQLMMAGMIGAALLHPVFLALTVHDLLTVPYGSLGPGGKAARITAISVLLAGYGAAMAAGAHALVIRRLNPLLPAVATMPLYWLLMSAAGWLALWQLLRAPFHWNKTAHGISRLFSQWPRP